MVGAKRGKAIRGGDLIDMCIDAEAPQCAAFVAADAMRREDGAGVVCMAMGDAEGIPAAFMIINCMNDVEMVIKHLREAAKDAFEDKQFDA